MSDESKKPAPDARQAAGRDAEEYLRRVQRGNQSLIGKLFPGPTTPASDQLRDRMRVIAEQRDRSTAHGSARKAPQPAASPDDIAAMSKLLDEQNEILRALLTNSIGTLEDARSTAQNSRTFAWAGIAIAFLTFVATVLAFVAAVAH